MDTTTAPVPAPQDQATLPPPATLPPVAGPEAATLPPDATRPSSGDARAPVGYIIERELGRGGMGVVYLARDVALHRPCALKMILAGVHSSSTEMDRFRTEAQAIARLQHPGIVQVFEIGEHDGKPFMALEFCPGGSLDAKLAKHLLAPRQAATLVKALAEAVHAAHLAQVIHRDLKPANVLLTDKGEPKVTDFGLAKKLDEQGATRTGSVMGTPSYMPPEQAEGKKDIGPTADVYALGAILYECLASRPPFRAATPLDTILQLLSEESVPVRQLNAQAPVDLETICARCLQKDPTRRYTTAQDLANDLERYLEGKPILARPVGLLERGIKWVCRNKVLSGAILSVFTALVLGTGVSMYFGFREAAAAQIAIANEGKAKDNETAAIEARDTLAKTAGELQRALDDREATLARSLLRPLALEGGDRPVTEPEMEALWELAGSRPGQMGYRFVEEATRGPITSRQFRDRAALAFHAAVGLDEQQRARVETLLLRRFADAALTEDHKTILAQAVIALDAVGSPVATGAAPHLLLALSKPQTPTSQRQLDEGFSALVARMEPREGAALLTQALKETTSVNVSSSLVRNLSALAARMEPKEGVALLIQLMKETKNNYVGNLGHGIATLASRMEAREAAQTAVLLIQVMKDPQVANGLYSLGQGLIALAARMEPKEGGALLTQVMKDPKTASAFLSLAYGLAGMAAQIDPSDAAQAATMLTREVKSLKNPYALPHLMRCLIPFLARMEPVERAVLTREVAATLTQSMTKTLPPQLPMLIQEISLLASRMEPKEGAEAVSQATVLLTQILQDPKAAKDLNFLTSSLIALTERMHSKDASRAAEIITRMMKDPTNRGSVPTLAGGLSALATRMEPREGGALLLEALKDQANAAALTSLAQGLSAVATRLEPKDATQMATSLVQVMKDPKAVAAEFYLSRTLTVLAGRMEPKDGLAFLNQTMKDPKLTTSLPSLAVGLITLAAQMEPKEGVAILNQAMKDPNNAPALNYLAQGLATLAERMDPKEGVVVLTEAMTDPKNANGLVSLAQSLATLAGRIGPKDSAQAMSCLIQLVKDFKDSNASRLLAESLIALARRLEPKDAARSAAQLIQIIKDPKALYDLSTLSKTLGELAARMEPSEGVAIFTQAVKDVSRIEIVAAFAESLAALAVRLDNKQAAALCKEPAWMLTRALGKTIYPNQLIAVTQGLATLAAWMEPNDAAQAAATLIQALKDPRNEAAMMSLGQAIAAVAARLDPKQASTLCKIPTMRLIQGMAKPTNTYPLFWWMQSLPPLAAQLDSEDAATPVAMILLEMTETNYFNAQQFSRCLAMFLSDTSAAQRQAHCVNVMVLVAQAGSNPFAAVVTLPAASEPLPCRFSDQQLVELLKMPTCSGAGRRVILDQLGNRHRRSFADHWEFVRFAKEKNLGLDFLSPPRRPEANKS